MKKNILFYSLIAAILVFDQITKVLVARSVPLYSTVPIIPGFFNITRIHNKGAIFGAFAQTHNPYVYVLLMIASLAALGLVIFYFFKTPAAERRIKIALSLILAGALGNLIDRLWHGYVIDFLDLYIKRWHWPFFNVADSAITIGAFLLLIFFLKGKPACSPSSSA